MAMRSDDAYLPPDHEAAHPPSRFYPDAGGPGWLVAHHLGKSFRANRVVDDVSVALARGEAVGLLGPNGAGKTTLFQVLTGLFLPDGGRVAIDGLDIRRDLVAALGRLGIVFRGEPVGDCHSGARCVERGKPSAPITFGVSHRGRPVRARI